MSGGGGGDGDDVGSGCDKNKDNSQHIVSFSWS